MAKKNGALYLARLNPYAGKKILTANEIGDISVAVSSNGRNGTQMVITIPIKNSSLVSVDPENPNEVGDKQIFMATNSNDNIEVIPELSEIAFTSLSPSGKFGNFELNLSIKGGGGKIGGPGFGLLKNKPKP